MEHRCLSLESSLNGQAGYELLSWSIIAQMGKVEFSLSCGSLLKQESAQGEFELWTRAINETVLKKMPVCMKNHFSSGGVEQLTQKSFQCPVFSSSPWPLIKHR